LDSTINCRSTYYNIGMYYSYKYEQNIFIIYKIFFLVQEKHLSSNHLIIFHFSYLLSLQNHKLTSTHKRSYFHSICSGGGGGPWGLTSCNINSKMSLILNLLLATLHCNSSAIIFYNAMRQVEYNWRDIVSAKKLNVFVCVCPSVHS